MNTIVIWDEDYTRIQEIVRNLEIAMRQEKIIARIQLNIEPPLLARNNLIGRTPVVQIDDGDFWTLEVGKVIRVKGFRRLLNMLRRNQLLMDS